MTEYVCDLPIEGIASFGMGSFDVPVREEIVRCRDCRYARNSDRFGRIACVRLLMTVSSDGFFCAWGERKEEQ